MARICLNPLTKHDGPVRAVGDVTVTLQPGKITGFRGPNGAGTTTTWRMPVELTGPTPGTPIIGGSTPRTGRGDRPIRCALARPCCPPGRASFHRDPPHRGITAVPAGLWWSIRVDEHSGRSAARLISGRFRTTSCCLVRV
jgi:ABC-type uncharacterized transport system ATPase subunit